MDEVTQQLEKKFFSMYFTQLEMNGLTVCYIHKAYCRSKWISSCSTGVEVTSKTTYVVYIALNIKLIRNM